MQLQERELRTRLQLLHLLKALRFTASKPDLDSLLLGNEQPTKTGTFALVGSHLVAENGEAPMAFVSRAGKLNNQIGTKGAQTDGTAQA